MTVEENAALRLQLVTHLWQTAYCAAPLGMGDAARELGAAMENNLLLAVTLGFAKRDGALVEPEDTTLAAFDAHLEQAHALAEELGYDEVAQTVAEAQDAPLYRLQDILLTAADEAGALGCETAGGTLACAAEKAGAEPSGVDWTEELLRLCRREAALAGLFNKKKDPMDMHALACRIALAEKLARQLGEDEVVELVNIAESAIQPRASLPQRKMMK